MDVFPQLNNIINSNTQNITVKLLKEFAWDFENDDFLLDNGKFTIVEGVEALKVRNYLSLKTYKGRFFIYKDKVGTKLKDLRGQTKNYVSLNVQEMLEEALLDNVYVTGINDLEVVQTGSSMEVTFTVENIYTDYTETITI